jgi:hypothetical protein
VLWLADTRKSKPIGVKLSEDGFQSERSALFARKQALKNFLRHLLNEEIRNGE